MHLLDSELRNKEEWEAAEIELPKFDSERISHLLAQNLKKRTENIPYSLDVFFHENA